MKKQKRYIKTLYAILSLLLASVFLLAACKPKKPDDPAHKHVLTEIAQQDATCTEKGNETYWKCNDCGKMFSDQYGNYEIKSIPEIAAKGHSVPSMTETRPADCTNKGQKSGKCERCGQTVTEDIPALGHDMQWNAVGEMHEKKCSVCGKQEGELQPHNYNADGHCVECGAQRQDEHKHSLSAVPEKDATCTEKGNKAYWKCNDCGKMFSDQDGNHEIKSIPEIAARGHSVPSMTETKPADCTNKGQKSGTCERCGQTVTEDIPALGHKTDTWQFDDSVHWRECSRCGQAVDMGDHTFTNGKCDVCNFDQNAEVAADLIFEPLSDGTWSVTGMTNGGVATYAEIPATHANAKVTVIGEKAFYATRLQKVVFYNESVVLDKACLSHCHNLTEVRFEDGVREIISVDHWYWDYPDYPFYNSEKIVSVWLGSAVNSLDTEIFGGYALANIDFSDAYSDVHPTLSISRYEVSSNNQKYKTDEYGILYNKQNKTLVFVPYKLTGAVTVLSDTEEIRDGAFGCVSGVTAITLPNGLKKIGESAFNATGITELTIPDSVTSLGLYNGYPCICANCPKLTKLHIGAKVAHQQVGLEQGLIGIGRFLPKTVTTVTVSPANTCYKSQNNCILSADGKSLYLSNKQGDIPSGVTILGAYSFAYNNNLTRVDVPETVTTICRGAFCGCSNLKVVDLSYGLAQIDAYAFARTGLTSITFPASLEKIACWAFEDCSSLNSATFQEPSNWKVYNYSVSTGVSVDLSVPSQNAKYLTDTYYSSNWIKVSA